MRVTGQLRRIEQSLHKITKAFGHQSTSIPSIYSENRDMGGTDLEQASVNDLTSGQN